MKGGNIKSFDSDLLHFTELTLVSKDSPSYFKVGSRRTEVSDTRKMKGWDDGS